MSEYKAGRRSGKKNKVVDRIADPVLIEAVRYAARLTEPPKPEKPKERRKRRTTQRRPDKEITEMAAPTLRVKATTPPRERVVRDTIPDEAIWPESSARFEGIPLARLQPSKATPEPTLELKTRDKRYPVQLTVRYQAAGEFVREYAENLSQGGLFIGGAQRLTVGERVSINLELPGYGTVVARAAVVHILDPETALQLKRRPGAGLQLEETDLISKDLWSYLYLLGQRANSCVVIQDELWRLPIEESGYQVLFAPEGQLLKTIADADRPLCGVLVSRSALVGYKEAGDVPKEHLILGVDFVEEIGHVLEQLDDQLRKTIRTDWSGCAD